MSGGISGYNNILGTLSDHQNNDYEKMKTSPSCPGLHGYNIQGLRPDLYLQGFYLRCAGTSSWS